MQLVTRQQSRDFDRLAMAEYGITGEILMGNAGQKIAEFVRAQLVNIHQPHIGIVCGKGNNGGDGYATAVILYNWGFRVTIYSLVVNEVKGDSKIYHEQCNEAGITIIYNALLPTTKPKFDLMIDGLLGTGFIGKIREELFPWVDWLNNCCETVSIDIPSGVDANSGVVDSHAVNANHTITMGFSKVGMMIEPGKSYSGRIHPVDIGFPNIVSDLDGRKWSAISQEEIQTIIKPLHKSTYKHIQGKVLLIAGSKGMTGAAYLSTMAALRSGAGLTITCAPASLNSIYEEKITEGMTVPCEDNGRGYLSKENYNEIMKWVEWCDVVAIGPGLGNNSGTADLVEKLVQAVEKPMVIDADGLRPFYNNMDLFNQIKNEFVITPHLGEMSQLIDTPADRIRNDLPTAIDKMINNFAGVLIAKFAPSLVAWGSKGAVNSTGNPGLATAGSGDVLTGMVASFMAQGFNAVNAAKAAIYIHGKAADQLAKSISQRGMIAGDLLYKIGKVLHEYES
ncbi:MAG: NAD(P)H-hydrate dehydratase [Candidatus Marinimicrobia bacterium]|jgi:NAD(P)H-hydrate epimerase|nr:NAD(P)H-hydrate dehydratase [Candidatus Neomarinimicrobiota bacterium]MBT3676552.1 NAD(P)H-hydrate dehydratase [Candidatus Neomarinimicrobiota bacterium]MBT3763379.1 NAD(P)H-hydrate dehydratase [Candidatus Neomarinimicrobiota bacterium]MBT4069066.1 NAD(P)H-hydrate dehydratase [Candidatus Neomarinimicrobiota bacterium]MBT4271144.1 NAD(P)H-hydrate dehydratase [Candidatus Neomarinimicrobiota bacterium]